MRRKCEKVNISRIFAFLPHHTKTRKFFDLNVFSPCNTNNCSFWVFMWQGENAKMQNTKTRQNQLVSCFAFSTFAPPGENAKTRLIEGENTTLKMCHVFATHQACGAFMFRDFAFSPRQAGRRKHDKFLLCSSFVIRLAPRFLMFSLYVCFIIQVIFWIPSLDSTSVVHKFCLLIAYFNKWIKTVQRTSGNIATSRIQFLLKNIRILTFFLVQKFMKLQEFMFWSLWLKDQLFSFTAQIHAVKIVFSSWSDSTWKKEFTWKLRPREKRIHVKIESTCAR